MVMHCVLFHVFSTILIQIVFGGSHWLVCLDSNIWATFGSDMNYADTEIDVDKPARLIIRLLFGFVSDSEASATTP